MKDNTQMKQLPTQQLEDLLHEELNKLQPDGNLVRQLLAELEERSEPADVKQPAVLKAALRYQQNCAADETKYKVHGIHRHAKWIEGTAAAAVLLFVLLLMVPGTANAESAWERLARWTDTVFEFFSPGDVQEEYVYTTDHPGLQQVYNAVVDLGITQPVVPRWIPKEYELTYLVLDTQPIKEQVRAQFSTTKNKIVYVIDIYDRPITFEYSKDNQNVRIYENNGIVHYVISNDGTVTVTWITDNMECSIYVETQEEVLYEMLDSIYETED